MGSISKMQKLCKEHDDNHCVDRISNLPSCLIGRILSLLPTKYAVATSVLSTRWKEFWTLVTSIEFDDYQLLHPEKSADSSLQTSFIKFAYRVLLLRKPSCLHKFRIDCYPTYDVLHINAWVAASLVCGVQELDLSIQMDATIGQVLPRGLFSCRILVVLKLGTNFVMTVPISVCLPSLKILHLDWVILSDDDSIKRLLIGCPVLDELSMSECVSKDVCVIHIFAPVLTKLILKPMPEMPETEDFGYKIVLDTPALLYLELDVESEKGCLVKNLCNLIKADISIKSPYKLQSPQSLCKAVADLLTGIAKVQCLFLDGKVMRFLHKCNYQLPVFHNLTSLKLGWVSYVGWELVLQLLQKSPLLEKLVFLDGYEDGDPRHWNPPRNVPTCLPFYLKVIEIWGFEGNEEELKMVEYFLKNAEVLEKLTIETDGFGEKEVAVTNKLLMLPRGSRICQVELLRFKYAI